MAKGRRLDLGCFGCESPHSTTGKQPMPSVGARALGVAMLLIIGLFLFRWHVPSQEFKDRAIGPVEAYYAPSQITVNDSAYLDGGGNYWEYARICMAIQVSQPGDGMAVNKVVMVAGDDDGGSFRFIGEADSIQQCKQRFYRD